MQVHGERADELHRAAVRSIATLKPEHLSPRVREVLNNYKITSIVGGNADAGG